MIVVLLEHNFSVYGNPFITGYVTADTLDSVAQKRFGLFGITGDSLTASFFQHLAKSFAPFGFHPRLIWRNFSAYYVQILLWYFVPLCIGVFSLLRSIYTKEKSTAAQKCGIWG